MVSFLAGEPAEDLFASKELVSEILDNAEFGTRGEGWLAGQVLTFVLLLAAPSGITGAIDSLAFLSLLGGVGLMTVSFLGLGRNLSPLPEPRKKHDLVTDGIYGYARHPMYGGLLLFSAGLAVLTHSETRLALAALLWWILENKVTLEEQALSARYPEYAEYRERVKKFLPYIY
ncbi:hypothetical protein GPECTOR_40g580 [Gonium pectorale]|uniref:Protein-S-isoprenylcysteine O-methyltransferase n=1 Tax=Gonium pectorale TaxID=33097 RepID=A0A150GAG9_GONPE|nr:hypothetical protein GPECTOR_40g580 [Gonium pectorale]|eukprot:KXZ46846.1 hypothetical protein GPECTOR_40g580 [Gonium pectorale]